MSELWERAYGINLARRTDRWTQMASEFEIAGFDIERWNAVDWKDLPEGADSKLTAKVPRTHNLLGHVACGLSHHGALKKANDDACFSVAVFEDDVLLSDNIRTVLDSVKDQIPDTWQFLYLGYRPYSTLDAVKPWSRNVVEVKKCYDAHAYVVRQPLLMQLVNSWDPYRLTTDWMYHRVPERFGTSPMVASQNKMLASEMDSAIGGLF